MTTAQKALKAAIEFADDVETLYGVSRVNDELVTLCKSALAELENKTPCGDEKYPLDAYIWKRNSTNEWVLEISGVINDTNFTCRHTEPLTTNPEDVAGLPTLYEAIEALEKCEPVLKVTTNGSQLSLTKPNGDYWDMSKHVGEVFYTSPQPKEWVGLSDDEVLEIYNNMGDAYITDHYKVFEEKLKQLNTKG